MPIKFHCFKTNQHIPDCSVIYSVYWNKEPRFCKYSLQIRNLISLCISLNIHRHISSKICWPYWDNNFMPLVYLFLQWTEFWRFWCCVRRIWDEIKFTRKYLKCFSSTKFKCKSLGGVGHKTCWGGRLPIMCSFCALNEIMLKYLLQNLFPSLSHFN